MIATGDPSSAGPNTRPANRSDADHGEKVWSHDDPVSIVRARPVFDGDAICQSAKTRDSLVPVQPDAERLVEIARRQPMFVAIQLYIEDVVGLPNVELR
jgi:hypothetical protein